jgi:hypothetical protein
VIEAFLANDRQAGSFVIQITLGKSSRLFARNPPKLSTVQFDWRRRQLKATRFYLLPKSRLWGVIEIFAGSV